MKKLLLILAFLTFSFGFAQEQDAYSKIASNFQNHYNNGDVENVFNMFDDNFKQVLTLEKTKAYFNTQVNAEALGKIKTIEYLNSIRTAHNYKVTFENGIYNAFFMLGDNGKLKSFQMDQIRNKQ